MEQLKKTLIFEKSIFVASVVWLIWVIFLVPNFAVPIGLICRQIGQDIKAPTGFHETCVAILNSNHSHLVVYVGWISSIALLLVSTVVLVKAQLAKSGRLIARDKSNDGA